MPVTTRTLPPEDAHLAIAAGGPLQDLQVDPAKLAEMSIAVVEVDGAIVAYWVCWYALHVEPLWVREDYRKSPGVIGGIVQQVQAIVEATKEPAAFCVIEAENLDEIGRYASRLGFQEAPGRLFYLVLQPAEPVGV